MEVYKVRAFTTVEGTGGNAAGVVLNAEKLTDAMKQTIAAKLGYSETAFHSSEKGGQKRLDFFTPTKKVAFCGHATVATYGLLSESIEAGIYNISVADTLLPVKIQNDLIGLQQSIKSVKSIDLDLLEDIAASVGLQADKIATSTMVKSGVSFIVFEVASSIELKSLLPDFSLIEKISKDQDVIGYYIYASDKKDHAISRMFAPYYGIPEESATGMGAICLMGHLNHIGTCERLTITQGLFMNPPSPSELFLNSNSDGVWVSGRFTIDEKKEIQI